MQAPKEDDDGRGGVDGGAAPPDGPEGAVGSGDQNNPREEIPAAEGDPQVERASRASRASRPLRTSRASRASRVSGQAAVDSTSHRRQRTRVSELYLFHGAPSRGRKGNLTVPFLSYVDAEVARRYLLAGAETYHGRVHLNLSVTDCDLFIRLTSEDADLLQISTASLLHRLSIVVQTMQHFVPQFCCKCQSQKGA
ncbi:unnamed protein product [Pipistrellus nathusii]|uniref:Uncharacterized protein n=1 Tax=Pipistrellus nathusii TaxID=59473 RepID=A0ABP0AHR1_PIPNA